MEWVGIFLCVEVVPHEIKLKCTGVVYDRFMGSGSLVVRMKRLSRRSLVSSVNWEWRRSDPIHGYYVGNKYQWNSYARPGGTAGWDGGLVNNICFLERRPRLNTLIKNISVVHLSLILKTLKIMMICPWLYPNCFHSLGVVVDSSSAVVHCTCSIFFFDVCLPFCVVCCVSSLAFCVVNLNAFPLIYYAVNLVV